MSRLTIIFLLSLSLTGCSNKAELAAAAQRKQEAGRASRAAVEYVQGKLPSWQVKGLSCRFVGDDQFAVDVDIAKEQLALTLPLTVQKFVPVEYGGAPYWRVSLLHSVAERGLDQVLDEGKLDRLNKASAPKENPVSQ